MANWYCNVRGQQSGPLTDDAFRRLALSGQLQPADLVWQEGMPQWVPAMTVRGLFAPAPQQAMPGPFAPTPAAPFGNGAAPMYGAAGYAPQQFGQQLPMGMAVAAMVLGIVSLALFCVIYLAVPCGILAIILGKIAMTNADRGITGGRGMAKAGLVMGIIACAIAIILVIAVGASVYDAFNRVSRMPHR